MPISYSIDTRHNIILEVWRGDITASDLARYWRNYLADPTVLSIRRTLVDLRDTSFQFSGIEFKRLITEIVNPILQGQQWITAIVVDKVAQFGVARQYQVFAEHYSKDAIFYDYEKALQWLLEQP
jgi:hypothetical protein